MMRYIISLTILFGFMLSAQSFGTKEPDSVTKEQTSSNIEEYKSDDLIMEYHKVKRHEAKVEQEYNEIKIALDTLPPLSKDKL